MTTATPPPSPQIPALYDATEAAKRLGISLRTVRRHTAAGLMPCHRFGRLIRYTDDDLATYIDRNADPGIDY